MKSKKRSGMAQFFKTIASKDIEVGGGPKDFSGISMI